MPTLISLSGLPGVGKTTLARALAAQISAIHLRVDSVEAALKNSTLKIHLAEDAGYLVLASVAKDNLLLGFDVVADTVNPIKITRKMWSETAIAGKARLVNVEVVCTDRILHQARVEARVSDLHGLIVPTWQDVESRGYDPWQEDRIVVDTGTTSVLGCAAMIADTL